MKRLMLFTWIESHNFYMDLTQPFQYLTSWYLLTVSTSSWVQVLWFWDMPREQLWHVYQLVGACSHLHSVNIVHWALLYTTQPRAITHPSGNKVTSKN